jgi:Zn-dependent protease
VEPDPLPPLNPESGLLELPGNRRPNQSRQQRLGAELLTLALVALAGGALTGFFSLFGALWLWIGAGISSLIFAGVLYNALAPALGSFWQPRWQRFSQTRTGRIIKIIIAPVVFILTKLKAILLIATKVKYFGLVISMIVSVGAYTWVWGLPFAIGFVMLLFIHEMGHVTLARREGLKVSAPMFIPFLGAAMMMRGQPQSALVEARVGIAGPIFGAIGCLLPLLGFEVFGGNIWLGLVYTGCLINLFNLVPMLPLDGGRIMSAVSPWAWIPGLIILIALIPVLHNPILIIFCIIGSLEAYQRWSADRRGEREGYHTVSARARIAVVISYFSLAALLAFGLVLTHVRVH